MRFLILLSMFFVTSQAFADCSRYYIIYIENQTDGDIEFDLKDKEYTNSHNLIMVTKKGQVKKTSLEKYSKPRVNGVAAITIKEGDELLEAKLTNGESQIILAVKSGKLVRFEEGKTRPMGRTASGVRGITLADAKDEVIGMVTVDKDNINSSEIIEYEDIFYLIPPEKIYINISSTYSNF